MRVRARACVCVCVCPLPTPALRHRQEDDSTWFYIKSCLTGQQQQLCNFNQRAERIKARTGRWQEGDPVVSHYYPESSSNSPYYTEPQEPAEHVYAEAESKRLDPLA